MKLKLPIFVHTDETYKLVELDVDVNYSEYEISEYIFYSIDAITRDRDNPKGSIIFSNGRTFCSPLNIKELEKLVDEAYGYPKSSTSA